MKAVLKPGRMRNFTIPNSHPAGCRALLQQHGQRLQKAIPAHLPVAQGKTALVLGSTRFGYGNAILHTLKQAGFSRVVGLGFEKAPRIKVINAGKENERLQVTAAPGWYIVDSMHRDDPRQETIFGNAFADNTRDFVTQYLRGEPIDLFVYALASGVREHLDSKFVSAIKVLGDPMQMTDIDAGKTEQLKEYTFEPATPMQLEHTIRVMGGDDLNLWTSALLHADLLQEGAKVVALSYDGTEPVRRVYKDGTLGMKEGAKGHINKTVRSLDERLSRSLGGAAAEAMFQPVVTQASINIPGMTRYMSTYLAAVAGGVGVYEDPLDVAINFVTTMYGAEDGWQNGVDEDKRAWFDQAEKNPDLQLAIEDLWAQSETAGPLPGVLARGYAQFKKLFYNLFGYDVDGVDYDAEVEVDPELGEKQGVIDLLSAGGYLDPVALREDSRERRRRPETAFSAMPPTRAEPHSPSYTPPVLETPRIPDQPKPDSSEAATVVPGGQVNALAGQAAAVSFYRDFLKHTDPHVILPTKGDDAWRIDNVSYDAAQLKAYAEATENRQAVDSGAIPMAYTFVQAQPAIFEAVKPALREILGKEADEAITDDVILKNLDKLGIVHANETITLNRPILFESEQDKTGAIRVSVARKIDLRKRNKGILLELARTHFIDGEVVATGVSRLIVGAEIPTDGKKLGDDAYQALGEVVLRRSVGGDNIDAYMEASGDHNLVHVSNEGARALGLPGRIMHGMWMVNAMEAALNAHASSEAEATEEGAKVKMAVTFSSIAQPGDELAFHVTSTDKGREVRGVNQRQEEVIKVVAN